MRVNDSIRKALEGYGGFSINERVYNYLGSLGYEGTISDRLAKYTYENKRGWQALIEQFGNGFSSLNLFSEGQQGAWYDPSDMSTLFQDAAGTVPVTVSGDPVGLMQDKSGNAYHASQQTSASRPVYMSDGTNHWLVLDGIDDHLNIPVEQLLLQPNYTLHAVIARGGNESVANTRDHIYAEYYRESGSENDVIHMGFTEDDVFRLGQYYNDLDIPAAQIPNQEQPRVYIGELSSSGHAIYVNGTMMASNTNTQGLIAAVNISIGRYRGGSYFGGNFYGGVILPRSLSTQERNDLESKSATWAGITL